MPIQMVDLCNMALAHLRQRSVAADGTGAITGDTIEAVSVRRFYELAMRECFRAFDWPFARAYYAGAKIAGLTLPNWKYAYSIPEGIEAVRYVVQNNRTEAPVRFHRMRTFFNGGNVEAIFTNEDNAWFAYTVYEGDTTKYPADFVDFAAFMLAAHLAMPITGKAELMMGMRKLADEAGKRAAATFAGDEPPDQGEDPNRLAPVPAVQPVDIANTALSMLGQPAIVTFGDRTNAGDTVRRFYQQAVRTALRMFDWPFARVVVTGQRVDATPVPNWRFAYAYPDNCAAFRYIINPAETEEPVRYQITRVGGPAEAKLIYTNTDNARFVITGLSLDPQQWPQDFVQLVAAQLAQLMALSLTGKAEALEAMAKAVEAAGKLAITTTAAEEGEQVGADETRNILPTNSVPVEVANLALGLIGQAPIDTFGERTARANAARRFYMLALRATLRSVDWPFARAYAPAVRSDAPLIPGFRYAFGYPQNCAALRGFAKLYPTDYDARYKIANGVIYTNRTAATLIYTRYDIAPSNYDPEFLQLLAHELALMLAVPLMGKGDALPVLRQAAKLIRDKARADAANEDPEELDERLPDWLAVRGIPSLTRQDRERWGAWGSGGPWGGPGGWGELPGGGGVNPTPPMISGPGPGSLILPAYVPGLTAPVEPPAPILSSSDFWVENVGGRIEYDGRLVVDDPSDEYREPKYDVQEDN